MRLFLQLLLHLDPRSRHRAGRDLADADARRRLWRPDHRRLDGVAESGSVNIDPYARATIARTGELPIGAGDGVAFYAHTDDTGNALDGRCTFVISGMTPAARHWTLTLYDPQGRLVANAIDRHGFTSAEILRETGGRFAITIGPRARPGNWLPSGGVGQFVLVWRLYDTPIGVASLTTKEGPMPAVARKRCS